jgi:hypothetical protein
MNDGERVYQLTDGWIFAQADHDLSKELSTLSVEEALVKLKKQRIAAVPVHTCKELADLHRDHPTTTVNSSCAKSTAGKTSASHPHGLHSTASVLPHPVLLNASALVAQEYLRRLVTPKKTSIV